MKTLCEEGCRIERKCIFVGKELRDHVEHAFAHDRISHPA